MSEPINFLDFPRLKEDGHPSLSPEGNPDGKYTLIVRIRHEAERLFYFIRPNTDEARVSIEEKYRKKMGSDIPFEKDGSFFVVDGSANSVLILANRISGSDAVTNIERAAEVSFGGSKTCSDISF